MSILLIYLHKDYTQVSLITGSGELVAQQSSDVQPVQDPFEDMIYYDPADIRYSVMSALLKVSQKQPLAFENIEGVSVLSSSYTAFYWDPVTRDVQSRAVGLHSKGLAHARSKLQKLSGAFSDHSPFSAHVWLAQQDDELKERGIFSTVESWLLAELTHQSTPLMDMSTASVFGGCESDLLEWDQRCLNDLGLSRESMATITEPSGNFGTIKGFLPLKDGTPVLSIVNEKQSRLLGNEMMNFGDAYIHTSFDTMTFYFNIGSDIDLIDSIQGTLIPLASDVPGLFVLESPISVPSFPMALCGDDAFQKFFTETPLLQDAGHDLKMVATQEGNSVIYGLSSSTSEYELLKAYFKSLVYHIYAFMTAFEDRIDFRIKNLRIGGDIASFDWFLEYLAEISQRPIVKVKPTYELILGAVLVALKKLPSYNSAESEKKLKMYYRQFLPTADSISTQSLFLEWEDMARKVT